MDLTRRQWVGLATSAVLGGTLSAQERQLSEPVHRVANARLSSANTNVSTTPQALADEHPLDRALQMAQASLEHSKRTVNDYTAMLVKREKVGGTLGDYGFMAIKVRNRKVNPSGQLTQPLSVYLNFLRPSSVKGREVIYVENKNEGNVVAHEGGFKGRFLPTVNLPPTGMLAMRGQRYPITEIGLENLIVKLIERGTRVRSMPGVQCEFRTGAKVKDRDCTIIEVTVPTRSPGAEFHKAQVFLDNEYNLPIRYIAWDWPKRAGGPLDVIEEYTYMAIELNKGLTEKDFDPYNKAYNFHS